MGRFVSFRPERPWRAAEKSQHSFHNQTLDTSTLLATGLCPLTTCSNSLLLYNVLMPEQQGLRARAIGLLIIAAIILLFALLRWGHTIPWSAR